MTTNSDRELTSIEISYKLNNKEKLEYAQEMTDTMNEIKELNDEKKSTADVFKSKITLRAERVDHLKDCINSGQERRTVEVYEDKDFINKFVRYVHPETGDIVDERPFNAFDYQMGINDTSGDENAEDNSTNKE